MKFFRFVGLVFPAFLLITRASRLPSYQSIINLGCSLYYKQVITWSRVGLRFNFTCV